MLHKKSVLSKSKLPIIIVPGMARFFACWNWKRILEKHGYTVEIADLYTILAVKTIREQIIILHQEIEKFLAKHNAENCHLIGFSMGGLVALSYLQHLNIHRVKKCVCVAAPFDGIRHYLTILAPFKVIVKGFKEILPNSEFLTLLSTFEDIGDMEIYTIGGKSDWACAEESCQLPFAENLHSSAGHIIMCCGLDKESVQLVLRILKK